MLSRQWAMTFDRVTVSFAELIEEGSLLIGDGYRAKNAELTGDGPLFLRSGRVTDGVIAFDGSERFSSDRLLSLAPKMGRPGDTVVTTKGNSTGVVAYVPSNAPSFVYSPHLSFWRALDPSVVTSGFIRYWARSPEFSRQLHAFAGSTDMAPYLSLADQRRLRITLPPPAEQRRIAAVLGALDNKIEHNSCLSARLADLALMQFEAARARWRTDSQPGKLGDLGGPTREASVDDAAYIGLDNMPRGSTVLSEWLEDATVDNSVGFRRGDVLFGKLRPYFKKVGVAPIDGRCSTEILVLRPHHENLWGPLVGNVSSDAFIAYCVQVSRGTKMPRSEWKDAAAFEVSIPREEEAAELTREMRLLYDTAISLVFESRTLRSIRDALLPKLVSGAIRVPDSYEPCDALGTVAETAGIALP